MEVKLIEDKNSPLRIEIYYPVMNSRVNQLVEAIKSVEVKIIGSDDGKETYLNVQDIYYIESLERKTFIYTKDRVLRTSKKLYQLAEELKEFGFLQANKGCLLNVNVLKHVRVLFNSRLEATLINDEKLIITRTYIPAIKEWLERETSDEE